MSDVVYLLRNPETGLVKIGHSRRLHQRVYALSGQMRANLELLGIIEPEPILAPWGEDERAARFAEKDLHRRFRFWRVEGEWFWPSPDILETFGVQE